MKVIIFIILIAIYLSANGADSKWTEKTQTKYQKLINMGFDKDIAYGLIDECKIKAKDAVHCIKIGASILGAESSMGNKCHNNNCVGMNDGARPYKTKREGINHWVKQYSKWWYKQKNPSGFYRSNGTLPPTRYCMGPKNDGVCKNGAKNAWNVFNSLNF